MLIDFAYDGDLPSLSKRGVLTEELFYGLLELADYTLSDRLTSFVMGTKELVDAMEKAFSEAEKEGIDIGTAWRNDKAHKKKGGKSKRSHHNDDSK